MHYSYFLHKERPVNDVPVSVKVSVTGIDVATSLAQRTGPGCG